MRHPPLENNMAGTNELRKLASRRKKNNENIFDKSSDENEDNDEQHNELLENIKSLEKQHKTSRYKAPLRSESEQQVSEFNLTSGDDGKITLNDLVGSLQNTSYHGSLKKTLESMQKMSKTVEAPLAKPTAERIQRIVAYEETSKDISKWEPTVQKNRQAEHISFPLESHHEPVMSTGHLTSTFKPQTPLEIEIAKVLKSNSRVLERNNKELSLEEEEALKTMSLEEALERRNELRKLRILQSHYEQKCRRMKKIKSKKYHRIKRKAEKRAANKETFEQLQSENPELAQIELEKAEKLRIGERMSLKHRNTSKWAKNIITRGIKDSEARQALGEQLRLSRQLTETKKMLSESEDEEIMEKQDGEENSDNIANFGLLGNDSENPWLLNNEKKQSENTTNQDIEEETKEEHLRRLQEIISSDKIKENTDEECSDNEVEDDEIFELLNETEVKEKRKNLKRKKNVEETLNKKEIKKKRKHVKIKEKVGKEKEALETKENEEVKNSVDDFGSEKAMKKSGNGKIKKGTKEKQKKVKKKNTKIEDSQVDDASEEAKGYDRLLMETDGTEVIEEEQKRVSDDDDKEPDDITVDDNLKLTKVFQMEDNSEVLDHSYQSDDDDITEQRMTIKEAFANDDVIEEFMKEKAEVTEASKPKDVDTSLPGWGAWGGPGVVEKKKTHVVKTTRAPRRKDSKLAHVIINDKNDKKITKNQVTSLPYPYTSYEQWERSIRIPLGKHWNTSSVHKKLVQPRITTLPGTIIEPIKSTKKIRRTIEEEVTPQGQKNIKKSSNSSLKIHR